MCVHIAEPSFIALSADTMLSGQDLQRQTARGFDTAPMAFVHKHEPRRNVMVVHLATICCTTLDTDACRFNHYGQLTESFTLKRLH